MDSETRANRNMPHYDELLNEFQERELKAAIRDKREPKPVIPALIPQLSQVVSIGYAVNDNPVTVLMIDDIRDEADIVTQWATVAYNRHGQNHDSIVGFNCISFDLPFIRFRAMANKIPIPFVEAKPWETKVVDVYKITQGLTGGGYGQKLQCKSFGIEILAEGVTGENLPTNPIELARYQESDVIALREYFYLLRDYGGFIPKSVK